MSNTKKSNLNSCKGRGGKFFWGAIILTAVLILVGVTISNAQCLRNQHTSHWGTGDRFQDGLFGKMFLTSDLFFKGLDLTSEQRDKLNDIFKDLVPEFTGFRNQQEVLKNRLKTVIEADQVNAEELGRVRGDYVDLLDQMSKRIVNALVEMSEVLTPEQRKAVMQFDRNETRRH